ncbi:glycine zipper 2TM domain-containing protein [Mucilaginibacter sp. HMF5004]|nr:glycine zipper 2TM domain-containing protein [Mucilaginibacter rivuli]
MSIQLSIVILAKVLQYVKYNLSISFVLSYHQNTIVMKKIILSATLLILTVISINNSAQAQSRPVSDQAKGAIVGGAAGAVAGGLIGHNVKGAIIGTAIGAGGGYIVGDAIRRKKLKKEAERKAAYRRAHPVHHYTTSTTTAKPKTVTTTTTVKTVNY